MKESKTIPIDTLVSCYLRAKSSLVALGYAPEIDHQDSICFEKLCESDFLREAAWVVLSSGMREAVVRAKFGDISAAFFNWRSSHRIAANRRSCLLRALKVFHHEKKIAAIWQIATMVSKFGIDTIKKDILEDGLDYIGTLPFMGPVTSYHLAKNIGFAVVKPDRHLMRISKIAGFSSPLEMCRNIEKEVGDKLTVIDTVLWRYATLFRYESLFSSSPVG